MKTENEIIAMPLTQRQKLWVEMKAVSTQDKDFANARAIIEVIQATDDWEEPEKLEVVATDNTIVDGKAVKKGETVKVYEWQFAALRRHLADPKEVAEKEAKKKKKTEGGAAAIIIGLLLLFFGFSVQAQTQSTVKGSQGSYWVRSVGGLSGGTNALAAATTNNFAAVTNTTIITNASWTQVNGIWTNQTSTVTNSTVNYTGIVPIQNFDQCGIFFGYALQSAGTGTSTAFVHYSPDMVLWQSNRWTIALAANGTTFVSSNLDLTGLNGGYLAFGIGNTNAALFQTNLALEVQTKSSRTGP